MIKLKLLNVVSYCGCGGCHKYQLAANAQASAGLNCCSKSASTNVYKDYKCFNEHANLHLFYDWFMHWD